MPFCTRCGSELLPTDNFCPKCGSDARPQPQVEQPQAPEIATGAKGLGRNTLVYITREGLRGVQIRSDTTLFLALVIPVPLLAAAYFVTQAGSLAVWSALWVAASGLVYDEMKWRGFLRLEGYSPDAPPQGKESWLVPWSSIRMADWNGRTLWFSTAGQTRKLSATFDRNESPNVERALTSSGVRYSLKGPRLPGFLTSFVALTVILFVAAQVILILAATTPFLPGEEQVYTTVLNKTASQIAGATFLGEFRAIFLNNIQVALGGAVPFLGTIAFGLASYNTGRVIQVIAIGEGVSPLRILLDLYILPHTWVEESAYPIAAVAGMLGVTRWRSVTPEDFRRWQNWGSTKLVLALAGAGAILLLAGFIETLTAYIRVLALGLWVPVFAGFYLILKNYRKRQRELAAASP